MTTASLARPPVLNPAVVDTLVHLATATIRLLAFVANSTAFAVILWFILASPALLR